MAKSRLLLATVAAVVHAYGIVAQDRLLPDVEIRLASDSPLEQRGREQLERLLRTYDLSRWLFTRVVHIQSRVIPHSHPVLTLNTQYIDNDVAQVATLIHEQLHWFLVRDQRALGGAIADLEQLYPTVPVDVPEGARGRASTYLHLLDCMLEFEGVREVFSEATARQTLGAFPFYTWVYQQVLERPEPIRQILRRHGLYAPDARR